MNSTVDVNGMHRELDEIAKKLEKVMSHKLTAANRLEKFMMEKERLMKYVEDHKLWMKTKEKSLKNIEKTNRPENLKKCKELNIELISQRENIENTKEHLNQLIRQFHSSEKIQGMLK